MDDLTREEIETIRAGGLSARIDRRVIASVSGGKDSAAMSLWLHEQGVEHTRLFLDTGWEHADTYAYLRGPLQDALGPITWARLELPMPQDPFAADLVAEAEAALGHYSAMVRLVVKKGMFPSRQRRYCTESLKVRVMADYIAGLDAEVINTVGIRAAESAARSNLTEWEENTDLDCLVWRPLIRWSEADVIAIHTRHGLRPNPLYLAGASRVGCWPCIFARKAELRLIADTDAPRIAVMELLEGGVAELARRRYAAKGETFASFGDSAPAWFQSRADTRRTVGGVRSGSHDGTPWPIRRVLDWARTAWGGRQVELFAAPPSEAGCVRWGLCDTSPETGPALHPKETP